MFFPLAFFCDPFQLSHTFVATFFLIVRECAAFGHMLSGTLEIALHLGRLARTAGHSNWLGPQTAAFVEICCL